MAADSLKNLHTALVDSRNGYEEAAKDAKTPAIKSLFTDMIALKERDHTELHAGLRELGEKPDESGSFMSTVHKTVISVRAAVTGLEANSLSSFVSGRADRREIRRSSGRASVLKPLRHNHTHPTKSCAA